MLAVQGASGRSEKTSARPQSGYAARNRHRPRRGLGRLEFYIPRVAPDRDTRIVVYCRSDLRGPLATKTLNDFGYVNAVNLIGGLKAWNEAGYSSDSQ